MQEFIDKIIIEAGALAMVYYEKGVTSSVKTGHHDLLTEADTVVSNFLVDKIHAEFPDHHIYSEEMAVDINPGAEYEWVIDPIDGTWSFANHVPVWGSLIAVQERGETKYAAAYFPIDDFFYLAQKGQGAFCNGNRIAVSTHPTLELAACSVSVGQTNAASEKLAQLWTKLYEKRARFRNYACMYGAVMAASEKLDLFVTNMGKDHDYLTPALIGREAGAMVTNAKGEEWQRGMEDFMIASPAIHFELMKLLAV